MHQTLRTILAVGVAAMLGAGTTRAQESNLARSYMVVPKDGMSAQFEAALKAHAQWRQENGDPWNWGVSTYDTGEHISAYGIRSGGHSWADFDAYDAGFGPRGLQHWMATVAPLVKSMTSTITASDQENSKLPPAGTQLALVTVTQFQLRPGREQQFQQLVSQAMEHLRDNLPGYWVWQSPVTGGGPGPWVELVGLYPSWADMREQDPTFASIMTEAMGQDGFAKWMNDLGQTFRGVESWTQRLRPDLGVTAAN